MPREISKDKCAASLDAATSKQNAKGSGGGTFRPVTFNGGDKEVFNPRGRKK